MERESVELDISRALAQVDQLRNAIESTLSGPWIVGVSVDQAQLNSFQQQLERTDFEVEAEIVGETDQLADDLQRAADEASTVEGNIRDVESGLAEASREADEGAEAIATMARNLGISEDEARQLAASTADSVRESRQVEDNIRDVARQLGLSEREARDFVRQLDRAGDEADQVDRGVGRMQAGLRRAVGAAVAFVGIRETFRFVSDDLVRPFLEFDQAINQSLAIVGDVTPQLRREFEDTARAVATSTTFAANEAGEAFFFLASAGLDAQQQIAALPQVAQFAQAGMFDLALATDLLTDAQSALGLSVSDAEDNLENMTRIADVLVQANILANASVQQFSEALTNRAGAALRIVNKDIEEGVAVLAAFADQGLKGEAAGEALNIVLRDLQRAALNNADAFEDMGVTVFDQEGNLASIADIVGDLEVLLQGMSDANVRATLTTLGFQDRSVSNLLTLLGTSEAIGEYERKLRSAGGATEEVAGRQLESFSGRLELVKSQAQDAGLSLGEALLPVVEGLIEEIPTLVDDFENLAPQLNSLAQGFIDMASGIASVLGYVDSFAQGMGATSDVVSGVGGALVNTGQAAIDFLRLDFGAARDNFFEIGQSVDGMVDSLQQRTIQQSLLSDLQEGVEPATALANALAALSRAGELNEQTLERFSRIAGLTSEEMANLNQFLRIGQEEHQFTREELDLLGQQYLELTGQAEQFRTRHNFARGGRRGRGAELEDVTPTTEQLTRLDEYRAMAAELGISLAELEEQAQGEGASIFDDLAPDQAAAARFEILGDRIANARERLDEEVPNIVESLQIITTETNEAGEEVALSAQEMLDNLVEQFETQAEFEANLARLAVAGAETLAEELRAQGPSAAGAAEEFVNDIDTALEAEDILRGVATDNVDALAEELAEDLADLDFTREGEDTMLGFALALNTPAIRQAIADNVRAAVQVVPDTVSTELRIESPSQVMWALGEDTALGFIVGFNETADQPIDFAPDINLELPPVEIDTPELIYDAEPELTLSPRFIADQADTSGLAFDETAPIPSRTTAATFDQSAIAELAAALTGGATAAGPSLQLINVNPRVESAPATTAKQLQVAAATLPLLSRTQPRLPRR